jgi:cytochrome P450
VRGGEKLLNVPSPNPWRNLIVFRRDPLAFFEDAARQGDIVRYRMGPRTIFFVNHPEYVKDLLVTSNRKFVKSLVLQRSKRVLGEGLLTSEGEFHMRQRRLAQPAFHRQRIMSYGKTMVDYAARHRARWQDGATLDMHTEMMRLTLAIVGKTLFDADVESEAQEIGESLEVFMDMFGMVFVPFSEYFMRLPFAPFNRLTTARKRLDTIMFRLIRERRASGEDRGDLLSMLLRAQDVEGDGGSMTDQQLRDECITLILAGHETTANALTWGWMLLAQNPEAEARLHAEVDGLGGRVPTIDDLPQLKYTEMVLAESMRLYPPAWALGRMATEPHEIGGQRIPPGSMVLCSQWTMHRDQRYHSDPLKFDPERWTPKAKAARPKFSYFPFGAGPRQCIGESFAWMEGTLLLATLAQQWKFRMAPGFTPRPHPAITLRPGTGMQMTAHRR